MIELLGALTASSDLVEQQRCQIADLHRALQQQQARLSQTGNTELAPTKTFRTSLPGELRLAHTHLALAGTHFDYDYYRTPYAVHVHSVAF